MNTVLSGEQLVNAHGKTDHEMPQTGLKEFQPSNSWLEQKQIQSALDQRKTLLEEERVEKRNLLMKAKWVPEKHKAEVMQKGKPWEVFGHHSDNSDWLFPEEVLFLLETNCLECLFGEVPLSIQKGHTILLSPEHGCSIKEYRVFSLLCRAGYRVVRHLSNLTVTAYERQIRLDQHLDQKKTYDDSTSSELEIPRPDLPPKKIVDLQENTEVIIDPSSLPHSTAEENSLEEREVKVVEKLMEIVNEPIEVITLEDSSSEESCGEDSSSDDSVIEIVGEFIPFARNTSNSKIPIAKKENDDDDIEIIEMPVSKKEIVVATIESSDSEKDNDDSDSGSEKSYDGNWKRNQPEKKKKRFVRPSTMSNLHFLTVDEFCVDSFVGSKEAKDNAQSKNNLNEANVSNGNVNASESIEYLSLNPPSAERTRAVFPVQRTRNEILDLMPTMANQKNKLMTLDTPDLRLIPNTIEPRQDSYIYNTYALRARTFSNFRPFRGRRHLHGSRFNSYNPYTSLIQNPSLTQMFGSDVHSMARGMLQFASALLMNAPPNNQGNSVMPLMPIRPNNQQRFFNQPPFNQHLNVHAHDRSDFSPPQMFFDEPPRNFSPRNHIRFPDSPFRTNPSPMTEITQAPFQNRNFGRDHSVDSRNSGGGGNSDFNCSERIYTPPFRSRPRGHLNRPIRSRPLGRNHTNRRGAFSPAPRDFRSVDPVYSPVDPAYLKSDIPLPGHLNVFDDGTGNFIPVTPTDPTEIIEVVDIEDNVVSTSVGISQRFTRKQKRKMKQKIRAAKFRRLNQQSVQNKTPEIIFLDSPSSSNHIPDAVPVKQESGASSVDIKTENVSTQDVSVKQEGNENISDAAIKNESTDDVLVKREKSIISEQEPRIKTEENSEVRVKFEHDSGGNLRVEIKIESSSDTSSVSSLPLTSQVKSETRSTIKSEKNVSSEAGSLNGIKIEPVIDNEEIKTEKPAEDMQIRSCSGLDVPVVENLMPLPIPEEKSADGSVESSEMAISEQSRLETLTSEKIPESDISKTTGHTNNEINCEMELEVPSEDLDILNCSVPDAEVVKNLTLFPIQAKKDANGVAEKPSELAFSKESKTETSEKLPKNDTSRTMSSIESESNETNCEMEVDVSSEHSDIPNCSVLDVTVTKDSTTLCILAEKGVNGVLEKPSEFLLNKENLLETETSEKPPQSDISKTTGFGSVNEIDSEMEVDAPSEVLDVSFSTSTETNEQQKTPEAYCAMNAETVSGDKSCEILKCSQTKTNDPEKNKGNSNKGSNWAEIKKYRVPLVSFQENEIEGSNEDEEVEGDEFQPLIRPKYCKTIGSVLSALQIFSPFSPKVPDDIQKLKISFDMYLATDFRKSQRGLPQFRIAVFGGAEQIPSPAQLQELQTRFEDRVPILRAVVMPDSVVFFSCSNISLPVDDSAYRD